MDPDIQIHISIYKMHNTFFKISLIFIKLDCKLNVTITKTIF